MLQDVEQDIRKLVNRLISEVTHCKGLLSYCKLILPQNLWAIFLENNEVELTN